LLNRYRVVKPYRGFESLRLRHPLTLFSHLRALRPEKLRPQLAQIPQIEAVSAGTKVGTVRSACVRLIVGAILRSRGQTKMSDAEYPYEKAIEQTAKTANNAIDLVREGGRAVAPAIADIYGVLIGDKIREARIRNLEEINAKRQKRLEARGVEKTVQPPEDIAIPLLEAAQGETRDELQELWARLLANAMDPLRADDVRPEFIETTRQLQPIDAIVLDVLHANGSDNNIQRAELMARVKRRATAVTVSLEHLTRLNCLTAHSGGSYFGLTPYGQELMIALKP
jgi:hypothetical protein